MMESKGGGERGTGSKWRIYGHRQKDTQNHVNKDQDTWQQVGNIVVF